MAAIPQKTIHSYLRHNKKFPHVWCSGCSNGIVLGDIIRATSELGLDRDDIVMVSGIGCSSRMPVYVDFNTLHSVHGRAIAYATGIKMFRPELHVIVVTGDGDATAIGGNHFIHAARRNIDITVILINNNIYGMTGGQYSPTTPEESISTTTPYGNIDPNFDICELAMGAGASFVARTTAFHTNETQDFLKKAIQHKGFSLVEIASTCPVIFGRLNKKGSAPQMLKYLQENSITMKAAEKIPEEERDGKIIRGILRQRESLEYTQRYANLIANLTGKEAKDEK